MSEAPGGVKQETVEPCRFVEGEMATATVGEGLRRSLLPLKRRPLEYSGEEEEFSEYHQSKRFLSEELMSAHLEHLRLSSEASAQITPSITPHHHVSPTPPGVAGISPPYPCQLSIKTVASCPQSLDSQLGRKRCLEDQECHLDEDMIDCEMEACLISARKRSRVDSGNAETNFSNCVRYKSDSKVMHLQARSDHQHNDGTLPHLGTDLSSIPEEGEPNQQSLTRIDTIDTSSTDVGTADTTSLGEDTVLPHIPISVQSSQSVRLALENGEAGGKVCSIWLAPEIKTIKTHADSPLPLSILKKIGQQPVRGMEIVPWVSGVHTLLREKQHKNNEQEVKTSESGSQDAPAATGDSSMMETN